MKKDVPNLIRINTEFDSTYDEDLIMFRYGRIIKEGYSFSHNDFFCYCALIIKRNGIESLPEKFKKVIYENSNLKSEIRFELIRYKILEKIQISEEDQIFFYDEKRKMVEERRKIIKKEIARTNINGKLLNEINHNNSSYYRELLILTNQFVDITIIDWFIPIVLKFERLIHIFIKHVEETKFAEGQFKNRTFFAYKSDEIWTLIKTIIKIEEKNIKEHFIENAVNRDLGKIELMKDYNRNTNNPIIFDGDKFVLTIDKNGFIMKFHQL
ncbi:MAG: hypothetical protein ACOVLG_05700 [Flavobacterium sp.]